MDRHGTGRRQPRRRSQPEGANEDYLKVAYIGSTGAGKNHLLFHQGRIFNQRWDRPHAGTSAGTTEIAAYTFGDATFVNTPGNRDVTALDDKNFRLFADNEHLRDVTGLAFLWRPGMREGERVHMQYSEVFGNAEVSLVISTSKMDDPDLDNEMVEHAKAALRAEGLRLYDGEVLWMEGPASAANIYRELRVRHLRPQPLFPQGLLRPTPTADAQRIFHVLVEMSAVKGRLTLAKQRIQLATNVLRLVRELSGANAQCINARAAVDTAEDVYARALAQSEEKQSLQVAELSCSTGSGVLRREGSWRCLDEGLVIEAWWMTDRCGNWDAPGGEHDTQEMNIDDLDSRRVQYSVQCAGNGFLGLGHGHWSAAKFHVRLAWTADRKERHTAPPRAQLQAARYALGVAEGRFTTLMAELVVAQPAFANRQFSPDWVAATEGELAAAQREERDLQTRLTELQVMMASWRASHAMRELVKEVEDNLAYYERAIADAAPAAAGPARVPAAAPDAE